MEVRLTEVVNPPGCYHGVERRRSNKPWFLHEYVLDGYGNYWCVECLNDGVIPKHRGLKDGKSSHLAERAMGYGISLETLKGFLELNNHCCNLCGNNLEKFVIDHDHNCCPSNLGVFNKNQPRGCGKCVRGTICYSCNGKLKQPNDNYEFFSKIENPDPWTRLATEYLRRYELRRNGGDTDATEKG